MRITSGHAVAALALLVVFAAVVAAVRPSDGAVPPPSNRIVPDQLIARVATEALGRAPSQDEWAQATNE
jgi:hypothetical protein